jgi:hypothetical protein
MAGLPFAARSIPKNSFQPQDSSSNPIFTKNPGRVFIFIPGYLILLAENRVLSIDITIRLWLL